MRIILTLLFLCVTSKALTTDPGISNNGSVMSKLAYLNQLLAEDKTLSAIVNIVVNELESRYEKCLNLLESVSKDSIQIARMILDNKWRESLPLIEDISVKLYETATCFASTGHADVNSANSSNKRKCVVRHVKTAILHFKKSLEMLTKMSLKPFQQHMKVAFSMLKSIRKC